MRQRQKDQVTFRDRFLGGERLAIEVDTVSKVRKYFLKFYGALFFPRSIGDVHAGMGRQDPHELLTRVPCGSNDRNFDFFHQFPLSFKKAIIDTFWFSVKIKKRMPSLRLGKHY